MTETVQTMYYNNLSLEDFPIEDADLIVTILDWAVKGRPCAIKYITT